ncbi:hypothetical protein CBOM_07481 [Ceraceosorus bombacis]|uniref:Uncharacterized protein n=1 Tax=Ceraceosorus bombacis TaxID=401625 RepID=A0A0P1BCL5_9BASI|nr:hypothetical protein CBOM_07481 [Ceraceosorus bombacis]
MCRVHKATSEPSRVAVKDVVNTHDFIACFKHSSHASHPSTFTLICIQGYQVRQVWPPFGAFTKLTSKQHRLAASAFRSGAQVTFFPVRLLTPLARPLSLWVDRNRRCEAEIDTQRSACTGA